MSRMSIEDYNFPVFGAQGGGLAREVNGIMIFITDPGCPGLTVGSKVPKKWGIVPANDLARQEIEDEQFGPSVKDEIYCLLAFEGGKSNERAE